MPKRQVHEVSDSDDECDGAKQSSASQHKGRYLRKEQNEQRLASNIENAGMSLGLSTMSPDEQLERNHSKELTTANVISVQNNSSLLWLDSEEDIQRTPKSFKLVETPKRPSRKPQHQMFAYILDCSPSTHSDFEDFGFYNLKRNVIDTFMQMRFQKNVKHNIVVLSCCNERTNNLSNREQAKSLNEHCVEIIPADELSLEQIGVLCKAAVPKVEDEQFSNVIAGLLTAADLVFRHQSQSEPYERVEFTLYSDLKFDHSAPSFDKMSRVLTQLFAGPFIGSKLIVVSNENAIQSETYRANLEYLKRSSIEVEAMSYKDAVRRSEQWTMAEQVPMTFKASIKLFDQELPIEAFLLCNEKNVSELETRLEKVVPGESGQENCIELPESMLREEKQLVKLTHDGHYMKNDHGRLVIVDAERAAMGFRFGTTAVPTDKKLTEYVESENSYKGYVVKGWYPAQQFALFVSGGKGYRVYPSGQDCAAFDSLLTLCNSRGYALLVEYAYQARLQSKPGVLIPHVKRRCFVFYTLVYDDNLNFLPRYDPMKSTKPPLECMEKMCDFIAASRLSRLELKYDPKTQQLIEDCWVSELATNDWKYHQRFADVDFKLDAQFQDRVNTFKNNVEGYVRRLAIRESREDPEGENDSILFPAELLDDKDIERVEAKNFASLFEQ